jgi:hypothetical protein
MSGREGVKEGEGGLERERESERARERERHVRLLFKKFL